MLPWQVVSALDFKDLRSKLGPIGVFDSGFGGLSVLKDLLIAAPAYDFIYLGDNARAPYGARSMETVYRYTREGVWWLFSKGCPLVILACNTASAEALGRLREQDLPKLGSDRRLLGVLYPTASAIGAFTRTRHVGVLGTKGTVESMAYVHTIARYFPDITVYQQACPLWVPMIENNEHDSPELAAVIARDLRKLFAQCTDIDTLILGCTHYALVQDVVEDHVPKGVTVLSQGAFAAQRLTDYLSRHPEIETRLSQTGRREFFTTDDALSFEQLGSIFLGQALRASTVILPPV